MTLKCNDTEHINITMNLNINWGLEYMEITVTVWNKTARTRLTKQFAANELDKANAFFKLQERFYGLKGAKDEHST